MNSSNFAATTDDMVGSNIAVTVLMLLPGAEHVNPAALTTGAGARQEILF